MRGVMEEKTSRVAEVIVSSVKPFPADAWENHRHRSGRTYPVPFMDRTDCFSCTGAQAFIPHELMQEVNNMQQANAMGNAQMAQGSEAAKQIFDLNNPSDMPTGF